MFQKGVPEKIIAERTGHRSLAGLRAYEKTTDEQEKSVCNALAAKENTFMSTTTPFTSSTCGSRSVDDGSKCDGPATFSEKDNKLTAKSIINPAFAGATFHGCTFNF